MEPERKIEKLLRAYAKKRKADAGDAFALHPATRRRLQVKVDRQFAGPPEEDSVSLWQLFRQQWAVLAVFALVIFFGASLFLPALSKAKLKSQNVAAMSNLKQIGAAAQIAAGDNDGRLPATLAALTNNHLLSEKVLTDPASGKPFVFAGGGQKLDSLASDAVLAYSPEDKKSRAVLLADGSVQLMSRQQFDGLAKRALTAPAAPMEVATARREVAGKSDTLAFDRPVPAAAPVVASGTMALNGVSTFGGAGGGGAGNDFGLSNPAGLVATASPAAAPAGKFFKDAERAQAGALGVNSNSQRFRNAVTTTAPVLVSFELQQNGNRLAIVDADGSVYQGSLLTNNPVSQNQVSAGAKNNDAAGNNFYFRVSGQNRTSKQNVVFSGNLMPLAGDAVNSPAAAKANKTTVGGEMSQAQNAALFLNSRIAGTATVDTTNQIEINAVPTTP